MEQDWKEYFPGEPEFDNLCALFEEWRAANNIVARPLHCGEGEAIGEQFEQWCKSAHPDVAEVVADDPAIYQAVLMFWCMGDDDDAD